MIVRVPASSQNAVLLRSGIVNDVIIRQLFRGDADKSSEHTVLWIDGDLSVARELHRQTEGACGLAQGKYT